MHFIGLDIGTSNIKALLMDENTKVVHISYLPNKMSRDNTNRQVICPSRLWESVKKCLADCASHAPSGSIKGIGISSMAEAGVPLDSKDKVLYPIIPWNDKRSDRETEYIKNIMSPLDLYKITGQPLHTKYPLGRFLWFKNNEQQVFKNMKSWLSVADFITFKLTGEKVTDYTLAARTMFYNIIEKGWDTRMLDLCNIENIFPQVKPFGSFAGYVRSSVLEELGVGGKIAVVVGAHDHLLALFALNPEYKTNKDKNEILDSMGTAEVFTGLITEPTLNQESLDAGISQGSFDGENYYWMTSLPSSGASIEWLKSLFPKCKSLTYDDILKISDESITTDIIYLPYINGRGSPHIDPKAKGSFVNIGYDDGIKEILKSIYEGTSFQCRLILDSLIKLSNINIDRIVAVGGGAKNLTWLKTKAQILNKNIETINMQEMSALGAALVASRHFDTKHSNVTPTKEYTGDLSDSLAHDIFARKIIEYEPNNARSNYYEQKYKQFIKLADLLYKK